MYHSYPAAGVASIKDGYKATIHGVTAVTQPGSAKVLGPSYDPVKKGINLALWQETLFEHDNDIGDTPCRAFIAFYDESGKNKVGECELHKPTESNPFSEDYGVYTAFIPDSAFPGVDLKKLTCAVRFEGPYEPANAKYYNPHKILMFPGAHSFKGIDALRDAKRRNDGRLCRFKPSANPKEHDRNALDHRKMDTRSNESLIPKAEIFVQETDEEKAVKRAARPAKPVIEGSRTILEIHVGGLTADCPFVPEEDRGTFRGMAHPEMIKFLKETGATSVELMPVLQFMDNPVENVWGYDPLTLHAIHDEYGTEEDFQKMVDALHEAGIEVICDVVYNHTAGGHHLGELFTAYDPKLGFRNPENWGHIYDLTGCGNTINVNHPQVLRLCKSSMRRLIEAHGVGGLRFDLGGVFGREQHDLNAWNPNSAMLRMIRYDPVLSGAYLCTEPYDTHHNGYHRGGFKGPLNEWDKEAYRTTLDFLNGNPDYSHFVTILAGNAPIFDTDVKDNGHDGDRVSYGSFVIDHDTPALVDMAAYDRAHNDKSEGGHAPNLLTKEGPEGPSSDPGVIRARMNLCRFVAIASSATHSDFTLNIRDLILHSQGGNTNPYCYRNPNTLDWTFYPGHEDHVPMSIQGERTIVQILPAEERRELLKTWQLGFRIRRESPTIMDRRFPHGNVLNGGKDITWLSAQGRELNWGRDRKPHVFGMMHAPDTEGLRYAWFFNSASTPQEITVPQGQWRLLADHERTADPTSKDAFLRACRGGEKIVMAEKSALVFLGTVKPGENTATPA